MLLIDEMTRLPGYDNAWPSNALIFLTITTASIA